MKKIQCLLMLTALCGGAVMAQKKTITGKVISQNGNEPLLGVNVLADKQKGGVATKADGTYSITVNKKYSYFDIFLCGICNTDSYNWRQNKH